MSDTERMLQPQGLFQQQRPFGQQSPFGPQRQFGPQGQGPGPEPWPAPPAGIDGRQPWPTPPAGMNEPFADGSPALPPGLPSGVPQPWDRPRSRRWRPGGPLAPAIIAAALILVVVVAVLVSLRGNTPASGTTAGSTPSASARASTLQERQAAAKLSSLLAQSGADRTHVIDAVVNAQGCGKALPEDAKTLTTAAGNRQTLLARLGALPGRSALPAAMITDLNGAWRASAQADTDLARWVNDAISRGCHKGNPADPNLKASYGADDVATSDKEAFVALWNPIARRYSLPTYTWGQI